MIKVLVNGCFGSMGSKVVHAVNSQDDMEVCAGVDISAEEGVGVEDEGKEIAPSFTDLAAAIEVTSPDVMVDFTHPKAVYHSIEIALEHSLDCVIGTTGLTDEQLAELEKKIPEGTALFVAPNFTTGAVLMMMFSKMAAKYFPDCEIIEYHHNHKADSPSGTAIRTASMIAGARDFTCTSPGKETEVDGGEGARGALISGVPVHSVRSDGFVAHQEVILGSLGQTLTIRHDSYDRISYMPGVLLAIRNVGERAGLIVGLENFMEE
ncbi:MAG: 4-hydroxy-tetrahydrodipicolinate reductase [Coriobacteriales bacterium]|jgi:4-hydroxy-tetrahydrodipicolinate reductase